MFDWNSSFDLSRVSLLCEEGISISYNFTPYSDLWESRRIISKF